MPARAFKISFIAVILLIASGCAPSHYSMHDAASSIETIRTIGIVQPDIKVFELSEDGAAVMTEVSEAAAKVSAEEIAAFFKGTRLKVKFIEPDLRTRKELQEVRALSKAVHKNIQEFRNPMDTGALPSLGSLDDLADRYGVEAFIFMDGFEVNKVEKTPLSKTLATFAVGTLYGPSALPKQNRSRACVSLAYHSGNIIWVSFRDEQVSLRENFMDRENTRRLVRGLLSRFPR